MSNYLTRFAVLFLLLTNFSMAEESDDSNELSALEDRMLQERIAMLSPFTLLPHKPNYFSPYSRLFTPLKASNYIDDTLESAIPDQIKDDINLSAVEFEFQLSLKTPIATGIFSSDDVIAGAYTHKSYWQAYNEKASSPFRESNHEPEIMYFLNTGWKLGPVKHHLLSFRFNHQSNGQFGSQSRSWNRLFMDNIFSFNNLYINISPWYRIPEPKSDDPFDSSDDDNPDIEQYLGSGDLRLIWKPNDLTITSEFRQNFNTRKGSFRLTLSSQHPLASKGRMMISYFTGYGDSLIDYNRNITRLSIGFMITDWL